MDALESLNIEAARAAQAQKEAADDEVGQNDFLKMLVAQLENQDPMNPQDSAQFAAQLAQFSSVEQLIAMRAGVDKLVAASGPAADAGASVGAPRLDPTNLVGKEVKVYGSQIEVDEARSEITMDYRTIEDASEARVVIRDADGTVVHQESLIRQVEGEPQAYLRSGDHEYRFDPADANLPSGVYAIEFTGQNAAGTEPIVLLPTVSGRVTGAILAGEPSIRMGNRIFSVEDVLEVSESASPTPSAPFWSPGDYVVGDVRTPYVGSGS